MQLDFLGKVNKIKDKLEKWIPLAHFLKRAGYNLPCKLFLPTQNVLHKSCSVGYLSSLTFPIYSSVLSCYLLIWTDSELAANFPLAE